MTHPARHPHALATYNAKRDFQRTGEPGGDVHPTDTGHSFVVQKHDARRLHFDFRLELDGVLKSWAIPKGPSLAPGDKRLAVQTEDHPVDYRDFEGTIPDKQYGAGPVIVWDRGDWEPIGDPHAGLSKGKLDFALKGERLHGKFTLVRLRSDDEKKVNWLLMKRADEFAVEGEEGEITRHEPTSVLTGRTVEDVREGKLPPDAEAADAPSLDEVSPQLATLSEEVPTGPEWIYEQKLDGYRALARLENGEVTIVSRNGKDWTGPFQRIADALSRVRAKSAVFDGEICHVAADGRTDFQGLQNDLSSKGGDRLVYYIFDLLFYDGVDLRAAPLLERKNALRTVLAGEGPPLRLSEHVTTDGAAFFAAASEHGLEGIVAKRGDKPYRAGRHGDWVKIKCQHRQELVIVGYTPPQGSRTGFGALLLGVYEGAKVVYVGKVGTGFSGSSLADLTRKLGRREVRKSALAEPPRIKNVTWVKPDLVCEVRFTEWTRDGALRHPTFLGLREDKEATAVVRESAEAAAKPDLPAAPPPAADEEEPPPATKRGRPRTTGQGAVVAGIKISHPERVIDEASGLTKLELARYHEELAPLILPHAKNRPLALVRCPEGTSHKCFFQKHAMNGLSDEIHRGEIEGEEVLSITTSRGLVELIQFGTVELHGWGCRLPRWDHPDWVVLDLDPDEALPFSRVVDAAKEMRHELSRLGLESFVKTTGGKGLHVVVPLRPQHGWEVIKGFSRAIAVAFTRESPKDFTATVAKSARHGRIFVDYLRNGQGATAVLPYAVRVRAGATVAMPLSWDDLDKLDPRDFTVRTVPKLVARRKTDPWAGLRACHQVLPAPLVKALAEHARGGLRGGGPSSPALLPRGEKGAERSLATELNLRLLQPLRVLRRSVEEVARLELLVPTVTRRVVGAREERFDCFLVERAEGDRRGDRLFEDTHAVTSRDDDRGRETHRVVETLDRGDLFALEDDARPHRLHPEDTDALFDEHGEDVLFEARVVSVHHIERHLDGVESKPVRIGCAEHREMDVRVFVARETDETELSRFPRLDERLDRAAGREHPIRVGRADDLVNLDEIDDVGSEPLERLLELCGGGHLRPTIELRHQEGFASIPIAERGPHSLFALATMIVPAIVEEVDSPVDRGAHDPNRLVVGLRDAEMGAAEADERHRDAGLSERAHRHLRGRLDRRRQRDGALLGCLLGELRRLLASSDEGRSDGGGTEKHTTREGRGHGFSGNAAGGARQGVRTTFTQPSFLSRKVRYAAGASSSLRRWVMIAEGSICPASILSRSG